MANFWSHPIKIFKLKKIRLSFSIQKLSWTGSMLALGRAHYYPYLKEQAMYMVISHAIQLILFCFYFCMHTNWLKYKEASSTIIFFIETAISVFYVI